MRSFCFLVELSTVVPVFSTPEYTRNEGQTGPRRVGGRLEARAEKGALSVSGTLVLLLGVGVHALDSGMSRGEGIKSTMASSSFCTPLLR